MPQWEPDGTQPPPPPQAWEDPVAGLVTGAEYKSDSFELHVVPPAAPEIDISEVRRAVDAVLADEEPITPIVPRPRRPQSSLTPAETPGIVPPNPRPGWPRTPSVRQLPGLRARPPGAPKAVTKVPRPANRRRPRGSTAGFSGLFALIIIIVVIVVTAINSLLDTITSLFR